MTNFSGKFFLRKTYKQIFENIFFFQIFSDIGNPYAVEMRKDLSGYNNFTAPGVEMHCLYGYNVGDTVER